MTTSEVPDQTGAPEQQGESSNPPEYKPNWKVIVPIVLISAAVLLVCLPICALLIVNSTGCCLNGPENVVTFWASMMAGFLALFGMLVTGVFVITSLRVEATARAQAQIEARKEVWTYIEHYHSKLAGEIKVLEGLVQKMKAEVTASGENAKQAFTEARNEVGREKDQASAAITLARNETTNAANEAQRAIDGARERIATVANDAQGRIDGARDEAIGAIDSARQEVEDAAREVQERAGRATGGPTQEGGEPDRSDE